MTRHRYDQIVRALNRTINNPVQYGKLICLIDPIDKDSVPWYPSYVQGAVNSLTDHASRQEASYVKRREQRQADIERFCATASLAR